MIKKIIKKIIQLSSVLLFVTLTSCLKTRSEVGEQDQTVVYAKKSAENQMEAQATSAPVAPVVDEKEALIRNLNGRVEVLENQLATLTKERESAASQDSQKMVLLQEALAKMDAQIQKLEGDLPAKSSDEEVDSEVTNTKVDKKSDKKHDKKLDSYEAAQQLFAKKEWRKAILSFNEYTDKVPRGKNVADAKFKIGVCFQELGMKEEAMAYYEEVVANYSKTPAGKSAKTRLGNLKK